MIGTKKQQEMIDICLKELFNNKDYILNLTLYDNEVNKEFLEEYKEEFDELPLKYYDINEDTKNKFVYGCITPEGLQILYKNITHKDIDVNDWKSLKDYYNFVTYQVDNCEDKIFLLDKLKQFNNNNLLKNIAYLYEGYCSDINDLDIAYNKFDDKFNKEDIDIFKWYRVEYTFILKTYELFDAIFKEDTDKFDYIISGKMSEKEVLFNFLDELIANDNLIGYKYVTDNVINKKLENPAKIREDAEFFNELINKSNELEDIFDKRKCIDYFIYTINRISNNGFDFNIALLEGQTEYKNYYGNTVEMLQCDIRSYSEQVDKYWNKIKTDPILLIGYLSYQHKDISSIPDISQDVKERAEKLMDKFNIASLEQEQDDERDEI